MFAYAFLFLLASILFYQNRFKKSVVLQVPFIVLMISIAGFRDMIGGYDIYIYSQLYELKDLHLAAKVFEIGFIYYYKFLRLFSTDRLLMILTSSVLVLGIYVYYLKKLSLWFYFSLFVFFCKFFLMSFVYIRQGLSLAICIIGLHFLLKRKKIFAFLIVIAASFFHRSSIIFLPFIFFAYFKFSYFQMIVLGGIITLFGSTSVGSILVGNIGEVVESEKLVNHANKSGDINIFYVIEGLIILVLAFSFRNKFYNYKRNGTLIFNGLLFYGFIILFSIANATFVRLSWYYFIFVCIGLPIIILRIKDLNIRALFRHVVFLYYALLFFRLLILYDDGDFMPYKSIFQDFDRNGKWEHYEYQKYE